MSSAASDLHLHHHHQQQKQQHPDGLAALPSLLLRLEAAAAKFEELAAARLSGGGGGGAPAHSAAIPHDRCQQQQQQPAALTAYDDLLTGPLKTFRDLSDKIGDAVKEQAQAVDRTCQQLRRVIEIAGRSRKPDIASAEFGELLELVSRESREAYQFCESHRLTPQANHVRTVAEGISALGWIAVEQKPSSFVGEMRDAAQFYANRVMKEYKEKDLNHVEWAKSYIALLSDLQAYVRAHHTAGLVWNAQGADLRSNLSQPQGTRSALPTPGAVAATPPKVAAISSLFGELNRGSDVTGHLKHVDKNQMTHKNPELRAGSVVKADVAKPAAAQSPVKAAPKLPPRTCLEGNKWIVENHVNAEVVINDTELKHVVYVYGCTGTTIRIKGKVNTVSIDNCRKTGVVLESTVAGVDLVNCKSAQLQILGVTPTVSVDKTDGCQVFMSAECVRQNMELLTAKSSEVNLSFPESDAPGSEFVERAVPEQFKTVIVDGKRQTVCVEHKG
ncbi:MAG: adenylate cyclase associated N terminal-domain-containing protein [Olpidium bornovanus]|uniref:Adenylyl cyclase-associated protein n=1 Tax=Olpidium bornovanus TaxID=278681 RepID=A0A8H7ZN75_9FUNG|nr:MAG: adenylate cyclase associated N terminal-domain-containing protein [Olpidium bornovanus]